MTQQPSTNLDALRQRLTAPQRAFVSALWRFYQDHGQWVPARLVHQQFGRAAAQTYLAELGENLVQGFREAGREQYRLTFLGVLLADQGQESEGLLVRYLGYVRDRHQADPRVEWVGSAEVEAALGLTPEQSRHLRQLIRLSHWWGGGSAFAGGEWTVGVPIDVDELLGETDLPRYVREHVLTHFPVEARPAVPGRNGEEAVGGPFIFVADSGIRQRLAADWHEAQDVCHVRGWKSCMVLCGGILEALLADALSRAGAKVERRGRTLAALVQRAVAQGLIAPESLLLPPALRDFQALVHPGRASRRRAEPTRNEAEHALEAVRACIRQLGTATQAASPAGAR